MRVIRKCHAQLTLGIQPHGNDPQSIQQRSRCDEHRVELESVAQHGAKHLLSGCRVRIKDTVLRIKHAVHDSTFFTASEWEGFPHGVSVERFQIREPRVHSLSSLSSQGPSTLAYSI